MCVIILEDTILHPDLPLLAWCMVVGEEYPFSDEILTSVIQIVADIATVGYKDEIFGGKTDKLFNQ